MNKLYRVIVGLVLISTPLLISAKGADAEKMSENERDVKTRIGILNPVMHGGDKKLLAEVVSDIKDAVSNVGGYDIFDQSFIENSFRNIKQRFPKTYEDPRTVAAIGSAVEFDRMIYGTVDVNDKSYGVTLTLLDVASRSVVETSKIAGDPGVPLKDVITVAVGYLHGYNDEDLSKNTHKYFGREFHNEKELLITTGTWLAAGFIWTMVNGKEQLANGLEVFDITDSYTGRLSGISAGADILPVFPRPASLGNSYIAASDDAYGVFFNPAGLSWVKCREVALGYQNRSLLVNNFFASYVNKATREIGFGVGFLYSSDPDKLFSESYINTSISYRFNQLLPFLRPLSVGANVKLISKKTGTGTYDSSSIVGSAKGFGLDLGAQMELSEKIRGALLLKNIPTAIWWNNSSRGEKYRENEPIEFIAGGIFQANYETFLICEGRVPLYDDQPWRGSAGIERILFKVTRLRVGVEKEEGFTSPWVITGGFGINATVNKSYVSLDGSYEYNSLKPLSNTMNFSLRVGF